MKPHLTQRNPQADLRPADAGHCSQEELLAQIYGIGSCEGHLRECRECAARLREMELRRQGTAEVAPATTEFLAQQRREIYARLERGDSFQAPWAPALAAAFLLALGVALYHPQPAHHPARHQASEQAAAPTSNEQLFSDLYSMEQTVEPQAEAPIHELFEDVSEGGQ